MKAWSQSARRLGQWPLLAAGTLFAAFTLVACVLPDFGHAGAAGASDGGSAGGGVAGQRSELDGGVASGAGAGGRCASTVCGNECVDLGASTDHCGQCGRGCAMDGVDMLRCASGLCTSTCVAGRGNCYQPRVPAMDDACETNLTNDIYHCGGCGRACLTAAGVDATLCSGGRCISTCLSGYANLDRPAAPAADDGCEIDFAVNPDHCGALDRACSSANVSARGCVSGVCTSVCATGYANVTRPKAPAEDDGCELNLATDPDNCGAVARACSSTSVSARSCAGGVCTSTCATGYANVTQPEAPAKDDGCELNLATDADNCGTVARACSSANVSVRSCAGGVCTSTCVAGYWNLSRPAAPAADEGCEALCPASAGGPTLVSMPEGYCIDGTEVTRDQYQSWLAKSPSTTAQDVTLCGWNSTFQPDPTCMASSSVCQGSGCGSHPQVCVDWCDAAAYCKGVGKRLCGRIGGDPNAYSDVTNASASQWYNACSSHGVNSYLYGNLYTPTDCNGADTGSGTTVPVGSMAMCQSPLDGYAGVFDLCGNVWEWEDSCNATGGQSDNCRLRGGSFDYYDDYLTCASDYSDTRNKKDHAIGLRCCAP